MSAQTKLLKKITKKALGHYNRQLVIRLIPHGKNKDSKTKYSLALTRRRTKAGSRFDILGTLVVYNQYQKTFAAFFIINRKLKRL